MHEGKHGHEQAALNTVNKNEMVGDAEARLRPAVRKVMAVYLQSGTTVMMLTWCE